MDKKEYQKYDLINELIKREDERQKRKREQISNMSDEEIIKDLESNP